MAVAQSPNCSSTRIEAVSTPRLQFIQDDLVRNFANRKIPPSGSELPSLGFHFSLTFCIAILTTYKLEYQLPIQILSNPVGDLLCLATGSSHHIRFADRLFQGSQR